jgi:hypothetical protein
MSDGVNDNPAPADAVQFSIVESTHVHNRLKNGTNDANRATTDTDEARESTAPNQAGTPNVTINVTKPNNGTTEGKSFNINLYF